MRPGLVNQRTRFDSVLGLQINSIRRNVMFDKVLVLNADMSPFGVADWQDAVSMVIKERATVVAETDIRIHPKMLLPSCIKLVNIVRHLWKKKVPWSHDNVHTRDKHTCQYCKEKLNRSQCTIDHVTPKDQGGKNSWLNCVCSCFACNNRKGNRTPSQAKMGLKKRPYQPTIMEFILLKLESEGVNGLIKEILGY
jgi:5-methylcytosine-specific restriction endonuclease McrA